MSDKSAKFQHDLRGLGFVRVAEGGVEQRWQLSAPVASKHAIKLQSCTLIERSKRLSIAQAEFLVDLTCLQRLLFDVVKKIFPAAVSVELTQTGSGPVWVMVEFSSAKTPGQNLTDVLPVGVAGFAVSIFCVGSRLQLSTYGHFAAGQVPEKFLLQSLHMMAQSLQLGLVLTDAIEASVPVSLFASDIEVADLIRGALRSKKAAGNEQQALGALVTFAGNTAAQDRPSQGDGPAGWAFLARSSNDGALVFDLSDEVVPVEVLETRELRAVNRQLEIDLLLANTPAAAQQLRADFLRNDSSLFLLRRCALLLLAGAPLEDFMIASIMRQAAGSDLTLISAQLQIALRGADISLQQNLVATLGRELARQLPGAERLRAMEMVVPELLGDVLAKQNNPKAMTCYDRILTLRGDLPRILRKMIALATSLGTHDREVELLLRAVAIETEPSIVAQHHYKLAQVMSMVDASHETAITHGLRALQADQAHLEAALLTTDLLISKQKYHDALRLLNQLGDSLSDHLLPSVRAKLTWRAGRIWLENLARQDLARVRFEQALEIDPRCTEAQRELARIQVVDVVDLHDPDADWQLVYEVLQEKIATESNPDLKSRLQLQMADVCRNKLGRHAEAVDYYLAVLPQQLIAPDSFAYLADQLRQMRRPDDLARAMEVLGAQKPDSLAEFYELLAVKEQDEQQAIAYLREAAKIYRSIPGQRGRVDHLMAQYLGRGPASLEAIEDFESVVEQSGSWDALAGVLLRQLEFYENDPAMRLRLWQRYGEISRTCLKNYSEAIRANEQALLLVDDRRDVLFLLANIAIESGDLMEEKRRLLDCLADAGCLRDLLRSEFVVNRLCAKHNCHDQLAKLLVPIIQGFVDAEAPELAGGLAEVLLKNSIATLELVRIAFLGAVVRRDLPMAEKHWLAGLPYNNEPKHIRAYLEDGGRLLQSVGMTEQAISFMRHVVQKAMTGGVRADLVIDALLVAGQFLLDKDRDRRMALAAFQHVIELDKDDNRSWIPFYYLLKEFGDQSALRAHLNWIVPLLERNQAPLKSHPITVESLEAERARLNAAASGIDAQPLTQMHEVIKMAVAAVDDESQADFSQMEVSLQRVAGDSVASVVSSGTAWQGGSSTRATSSLAIVTSEFVDQESSLGDAASALEQGDEVDWRSQVASMQVSTAAAIKTLDQAFAVKIEKHVAIQAMAMLAGDIGLLQDWQWPVWRDFAKVEYSLSGKERFPSDGVPGSINSDLHRLLVAAVPILAKLFNGRYSLRHLQKKLGLTGPQIAKARVALVWDRGLLARSGFALYKERIRKHRFSAYNLSGLGAELFFDGSRRELYLDESYYMRQPPSHLFHRVLGLLWSIKLQYFVPLSLDVETQILPSIEHMRGYLGAKAVERLKQAFIGDGQDIARLLSVVDKNELRVLFDKVPSLSAADVRSLQREMQSHVYRLLLAETLDLVGLVESVADVDLLGVKMAPGEVVSKSPQIADILAFATQLRLSV